MFNPCGIAVADCYGEQDRSDAVAIHFGFDPATPYEVDLCHAIREGFESYLDTPPDEWQPLFTGTVTVEHIRYDVQRSKPSHFKTLGAFAFREFQKQAQLQATAIQSLEAP